MRWVVSALPPIKLLKNVKNDAGNEARAAKLPSFDTAALLYRANQNALRADSIFEQTILREVQRFIDWYYHMREADIRLRMPDGLRPVLDSASEFEELTAISVEMDALAREVAKEQNAASRSRMAVLVAHRRAASLDPSWSCLRPHRRFTFPGTAIAP